MNPIEPIAATSSEVSAIAPVPRRAPDEHERRRRREGEPTPGRDRDEGSPHAGDDADHVDIRA